MKHSFVVYKGTRYDIKSYRDVYGEVKIWEVYSKGKVVDYLKDRELKEYIYKKLGVEK